MERQSEMKRKPQRSRARTPAEHERQARKQVQVLQALTKARRGMPPTRAAREAGTTLETMRRYAPGHIRRRRNGRLAVSAVDYMRRPMKMLTEFGTITVNVRDSRTASRLGKYLAAVRSYTHYGHTAQLTPFEGKTLRVDGFRLPYITNVEQLDRLAWAGELDLPEIYDTLD
jgi:hypothetical protein